MAQKRHIEYLYLNKDIIEEPILIVGSKLYDYDQCDPAHELRKMGFSNITGIDLDEGPGVDRILDITDQHDVFFEDFKTHFGTIICFEMLTHVPNPFTAAKMMALLARDGGALIVSDCFVRKLSKMPHDYWRFSYDGFKVLFREFMFDDQRARFSLIRHKNGKLRPFPGRFEEVLANKKHPEESHLGFMARRLHRRFLSDGIFKISRWLPEQNIFAAGQKNTAGL